MSDIIHLIDVYAQANLDALDMTLNEEIPTAAKSQLSADEALSQFQSVVPTESQQIGRSHIDVPKVNHEVCRNCQSILKADICDKCGERNYICQADFLVSEYLKKIAELTSNIDVVLSIFLNADITKEDVRSWQSKNASVIDENVLNNLWAKFKKYMIAYDAYPEIRIYKERQDNLYEEENAVVKKSVYLNNDNKIPRLWMYFLEFEREEYGEKEVPDNELSKSTGISLVQDYFLLQGLVKLFGVSIKSDNFINMVKSFVEENKSKINAIRSMFQSTPVYLGGGVDGAAFSIGPNLVLKLFRDNYSYNSALQAIHRLHNEPELAKTEAMIYDVGVLGTFRGHEIYYYIMEKMKPIDALWEDNLTQILPAINYYIRRDRDKWKELRKNIADPKYHNEIKQEVLKSVEAISSSIKGKKLLKENIKKINEKYENLNDNWLELLVEEMIIKYLTGRTDLHIGNLGVTNYGEFRYFDPSFGDAEENLNLPAKYHAANRRLVDERFVKLAGIIRKY